MSRTIEERDVFPGGKLWVLAFVGPGPGDLKMAAASLAKKEAAAREDLERLLADAPGETLLIEVPYDYVRDALPELPVVAGRIG